jgi:hypothetical protein
MKRIVISAMLAVALMANAQSTQLIKIADNAYASTSVNAAIFRASSLATHGNTQYAAYYDGDGYLTLAARELGATDWTVERSQYKGNVADGHNVISLAFDGNGYVHVAFDHHGNALKYCRSVAPNSLKLGELVPMTGVDEDNVTYPEFYTLKNGDLLFAYRSGASGRGNLVMNTYDLKTATWSRLHDVLIDGENQRNAYWQINIDPQGTIHLSWVWRETWLVETNHDLCYAKSVDNGKTWQRSNGSTYELPITASTAEYAWRIPQNSELINQTSMCADSQGNPYIATYWRDADSKVPQYRVVRHDSEGWHAMTVGERKTPFSLSGGGTKMIPISRPRMVSDGDNLYFFFRDVERGNKVSMATYSVSDASQQWMVTDITNFAVDAWEPSLDVSRWNREGIVDLYVQNCSQGDGERTVAREPQSVYVLEVKPEVNPVLPGFHADPEILYSHKTNKYYIYSTTDGVAGWGGTYYTCFSSENLKDWTFEGKVLDLASDQVKWADGNCWAPAIEEKLVDGQYLYYLYFSGNPVAGGGKEIGVAVSYTPVGPFVDLGHSMINSSPAGKGQQIDVDVFTDEVSGKSYLYWGNGYMAGAELNDDMSSIKPLTITVMTPKGGTLQDYNYREAPYVFYRNGLYYFMWSVDDTGSPNYHVAYGTSTSPLGPITVAENPVILSQDPDNEIYGTAHNSIIKLPGTDEWRIVYHRINKNYLNDAPGIHREVCIDPIYFNPDGTIIPVKPSR